MTQGSLFQTDQEARQGQRTDRAIQEALKKHRAGSQKWHIIQWFLQHRKVWYNRAQLANIFGLPASGYFVGINYDRRLRELCEAGVLESQLDPEQGNNTHRWRMP
jgi:hypothetical protein